MDRAALGVVSACLTASCSVPYLCQIGRRRARPQRMTWFIFSSVAIIAAAAQISQSADAGAWLAAGSAVGFGAIFVASLWRGVGGTSRFDLATLAVAVTSAALLLAGFPIAATVCVIVAEVAATGLTVRKAAGAPGEESVSSWAIDGFAALLAIVAVRHLSVDELMYPINALSVNLWVVGAVMIARHRSARGVTDSLDAATADAGDTVGRA